MSNDSVIASPQPEPETMAMEESQEMETGPPQPEYDPVPPKKSCPKRSLRFLLTNIQTVCVMVGVFLGIATGFVLRAYKDKWTEREIMRIGFVGEIFLNALRLVTLPLIIASITSAVGSLDVRLLSRIGGRAIGYYALTTITAVIIGIALSLIIQPGTYKLNKEKLGTDMKAPSLVEDVILDMIRSLFPANIFQATIHSYKTKLSPPDTTTDASTGDSSTTSNEPGNTTTNYELWKVGGEYNMSTNIMGILLFSVVLGVALAKMKGSGRVVLVWITGLSDALLKTTNWIIWTSPVGMFSMLAAQVVAMEDMATSGVALGIYVVTVLTSLFIHGLIILPLYYLLFVRKLPFRYMLNCMPPMVMALSTASSLATLPVTITTLENRCKMDKRITRFLLPIGATINMDGMALYEAVAVVFVGQASTSEMNAGKVIIYSLISTLASVGASGIPNGGIVITLLVFEAVGFDISYIAFIITADWFLDRFSTALNVFGDCMAVAIVGKWCSKDLISYDEELQKKEEAEENRSRVASREIDPQLTSSVSVDVEKQRDN